ncbi:MAG: hypothetical protein Q4E43_03380 [Akkermansia sp.]|nr:hypothetical protein [Akkermansia sp.]
MKIEVGESLIYSWLRHVKKCQIAQTNWKTSPLWKAAPDRKEDMRAVVAEIQQHFIALNLNVFKNDQDLEQALRQVEGDVIGISWFSGEPTLYAAESAFHESGLNYGPKEVTCAKVISKLARTAIALQIFLPGLKSELFFAAPKIHNNIMEILPKAISELNAIFERHSMNCKARLIANGGFQREILEPVKALQENVSDTSEIFLRSLQMVNLFSRGRRHTDIIEFVDENEVSGNDEDEDSWIEDEEVSGIDDEEFGEIEDNIFAPRDERRTIRPVMRYSGREFNKVTASGTVDNYPDLSWMNIRVAKLNHERLNGRQFYFYCNVHNIEYLYSADVEALRNFCLSCKIIENQPRRYSFYIDYDRGILRANPGGGNVTLQLQRLPVDYCELHRE